MLRYDMLCCYLTLRYVMLCYVKLCYVMLSYVTLCYVTLCYVMLYVMHVIIAGYSPLPIIQLVNDSKYC